jgi:hypothetical protein
MIGPGFRRSLAIAAALTSLPLAGAATAHAQGQLAPNCNPPSISGTALDRQTLTANAGSCSGPTSPNITLQWFICSPDLVTCTARTRQIETNSLAYQVVEADVNGRLVAQQTARNQFGIDQDETITEIVAAIPPSATPEIFGTARVGEHLVGSEGFLSGTSPTLAGLQWLRCEADGSACVAIPAGTTTTYSVTNDDLGKRIVFQVTVAGPQHTVDVRSAPTPPVEGIPPPPPGPPALRPLRPFPVVVIAGRAFEARSVVSTLLVRGPRRARVTVACRGRSCPVRRQRRRIRGGSLRLRRFETGLMAGTVIEIRVTSPNRIGKFTRLRILRDRPPARTDLCLRPGRRRPVRCPRGAG